MGLFGDKSAPAALMEVAMNSALGQLGLTPEQAQQLIMGFFADHAEIKAAIARIEKHMGTLPGDPMLMLPVTGLTNGQVKHD